MRVAPWCLPLLLCACARPERSPTPPTPPPPVNVPAGCLGDLSGTWLHDEDPSWRYDAVDDGGTVTLVVSRVDLPVDAGFRPRRFRDAGVGDAGLDAGRGDAGVADAGRTDAGPLDAGADAGLDATGREASAEAGAADGSVGTDAGTAPSSLTVRLTRTPAGFIGETSTSLPHPLGRVCEVHFKTEVLACTDGGLLLRTESATALGDSCEAPAKAQPVPMAEHHLHRP